MDSFDILSDSEEALLDEIIVRNGDASSCGGGSHRRGTHRHFQRLKQRQRLEQYSSDFSASTSTSIAPTSSQRLVAQHFYDPTTSPIHYCDNVTHCSEENSYMSQESFQQPRANVPECRLMRSSESSTSMGSTTANTVISNDDNSGDCLILPINAMGQLEFDGHKVYEKPEIVHSKAVEGTQQLQHINGSLNVASGSGSGIGGSSSGASTAASGSGCVNSNGCGGSLTVSSNHQLTTDMCNPKNSKSRRLEYSLKCLKYGRSNPSQDSAFGSLTDNDLSTGSSSFRLSSFQSISSPIDEGVEDVIIATTTVGKETCLELATIPRNMVSQDSAISSPCRETSPNNFLNIEDGHSSTCSANSSTSGSTSNVRPQQFPVSLSPKILVTATTNSSNSSLASSSIGQSSSGPSTQQQQQQQQQQQPQQQFDPPKILVNDQNSIYTTSPSKRIGSIEVFSQKYRVSSFEDMSPSKRIAFGSDRHLKHANRMAFRSLEEERRIDSAFMPMADRTNSENRVNLQSEKYKKLTHASFCISKTSSQVAVYDISPCQQQQQLATLGGSSSNIVANAAAAIELQRPATATGSTSSNRQTMWRDSKFYRKNRIAKSNDSLLEISPIHSARLSPSSLRDNHYESSCCSSHGGSRSQSRQSLNRGCSINEIIVGSTNTLGLGLSLITTSFGGNPIANANNNRRYCSSKSEDLGESKNDYLRVMDARKSYSERHLVTLTKLKQTAITNSSPACSDQCCMSEDEISFNDENNASAASGLSAASSSASYQYQKELSPQHQSSASTSAISLSQQIHQRQRQKHHHQQYSKKSQQHQQCNYIGQRSQSSNNSSNYLKTTNIKTTSLAMLSTSCQQQSLNQQNLNNSSSSASTTTSAASSIMDPRSPQRLARSPVFRALRDSSINNSSGNCTGGDENSSSADDSPHHHTLSAVELFKIFTMDEGQNNGSYEEKTPLLDSLEMSPMLSPTESEKGCNE